VEKRLSRILVPQKQLLRTVLLGKPPGAELTFEFPGLAVGIKSFADPMKSVCGDLCKAPARGCTVKTNAYLNDITTDPAPNLLLAMAGHGVDPVNAPRLNRGIPNAQGRAVHIVGLV